MVFQNSVKFNQDTNVNSCTTDTVLNSTETEILHKQVFTRSRMKSKVAMEKEGSCENLKNEKDESQDSDFCDNSVQLGVFNEDNDLSNCLSNKNMIMLVVYHYIFKSKLVNCIWI